MSEGFRFTADRRGIIYRGQEFAGFPYLKEMSDAEQLRVARLADQLTPDKLSAEQLAILARQPELAISESRRDAGEQDRVLGSPLVRSMWNSLPDSQKDLVLNPEPRTGSRYPLTTGQLVDLTGLTKRMVQTWADRGILPHWTDTRRFRFFETPAAIIAFALQGTAQAERQFYCEIGTATKPLSEVAVVVSMIGLRVIATSSSASGEDLERAEEALRAAADTVAAVRVRH